MAEIHCRYFSGYKPCSLNKQCDLSCSHRDIPQKRILIIHLGALGAVLRATSLLSAIKRKYPSSHITWLTQAPADKLLENNKLIDRCFSLNYENELVVKSLEYDEIYCNDKSMVATAIANSVKTSQIYGFKLDVRSGAILPATDHAKELWKIGLCDEIKFYKNKKPETQLMCESLNLPYKRDDYQIDLTEAEKQVSLDRKKIWSFAGEYKVVGINTGCASVIAYKKLSIKGHQALIKKIQKNIPGVQIVLLGGKEDRERNLKISSGLDVILSPTNYGLRDGLCSVEACDIVITGDSLGMHMSIALKKWVIAWFGPTCAHEIDLYGRGVKVLTQANCSPCWKRNCSKSPMCYDMLDWSQFLDAINKGLQWKSTQLSYKQPFLEMHSSVSL